MVAWGWTQEWLRTDGDHRGLGRACAVAGLPGGLVLLLVAFTLAAAEESPGAKDPLDELLEFEVFPVSTEGGMTFVPWTPGPDGRPAADAPAEALIEFWTRVCARVNFPRRLSITAEESARVLTACEEYPMFLDSLLRCLPETPESVERVRKLQEADREHLDGEVAEWLLLHGAGDRQLLVDRASKASVEGGWIRDGDALIALAGLDWEAASPILARFAAGDEPRIAALALGLQFERAARAGERETAESLRGRLQGIVASADSPGGAREWAARWLARVDWPGRDAWFLALLDDSSLHQVKDGYSILSPLAQAAADDPDHWVPRLIGLVGGTDPEVHEAAVECLSWFCGRDARPDVLRALLAWVDDPGWAASRNRAHLLEGLAVVRLSESVPGLVRAAGRVGEDDLAAVAKALGRQADPRAIEALRAAFPRAGNEWERSAIAGVLVACGMSVEERVEAILASASWTDKDVPIPQEAWLQRELGRLLSDPSHADEAVAAELLRRAAEAEMEAPALADRLVGVVRWWDVPSSDRMLVDRIASRRADTSTIVAALGRGGRLASGSREPLEACLASSGLPRGVAAVLLRRDGECHAILEGGDDEARRALLACARLVRQALPPAAVGPLLDASDERLVRAARVYLEACGGEEGRKLVLERAGGQPRILGSRPNWDPGHATFSEFDRWEAKLLGEVTGKDGPEEVVALLSAGYWGDAGQVVIRVKGSTARLVRYRVEGREEFRDLAADEVVALRAFLVEHRIDDLPACDRAIYDGMQYEYVRLTRAGGVRVFMNNPPDGRDGEGSYGGLMHFFGKLADPDRLRVRYAVCDAVEGASVLLSDRRAPVLVPLMDGSDLLLLVQKEGTQEVLWRGLVDGALGAERPAPAAVTSLDIREAVPKGWTFFDHLHPFAWQSRVDGARVFSAWATDRPALWSARAGVAPVKIADGEFARPIATPDGAWVVAAKSEIGWAHPNPVVRINPKTGEESRLDIEPADTLLPVAHVPAHDAVLVWRRVEGASPSDDPTAAIEEEHNLDAAAGGVQGGESEYYLVVPATGGVRRVEGEFQPWHDQSFRPLQPTGRPNEVWAALPDVPSRGTAVGRYDTKAFAFKVAAVYPDLGFDSMHAWVDEAHGVVYVSFAGDLLSLPLDVDGK